MFSSVVAAFDPVCRVRPLGDFLLSALDRIVSNQQKFAKKKKKRETYTREARWNFLRKHNPFADGTWADVLYRRFGVLFTGLVSHSMEH